MIILAAFLSPQNSCTPLQALNLFRRKTGTSQHFGIRLQKRVPHGAGLGGGSGNAATAMWAANESAGRPATAAELLDWSADIGSDISVFFSLGAAYCTGRCVLNPSGEMVGFKNRGGGKFEGQPGEVGGQGGPRTWREVSASRAVSCAACYRDAMP